MMTTNLQPGEVQETREIVRKPSPDGNGTTEYVKVRRRRGSKRQALQADAPVQRFRIVLLLIVIVLLILVFSGMPLNNILQAAVEWATRVLPRGALLTLIRPEIILLLVAACVLIYLMVPGLDDHVLRFLGLRTRSRRRHSR